MNTSPELAELTKQCKAFRRAEKPAKILRNLLWPASVRREFFNHDAQRLPKVSLPQLDTDSLLADLTAFRSQIPAELPFREWLVKQADIAVMSAELLAARGTPRFLDCSRQLFGLPSDPVLDGTNSALGLATTFDQTIDQLTHIELDLSSPLEHDADDVAESMTRALDRLFGEAAPPVEVVDELSANALAGVKRVRIRRGARFTDKDIHQLIHHEAGIHVATSLNGRSQSLLPVLASAHPGTTRTQEGLAVFSEFITGSIELDRLRRLADRVIAIQMAVDGADFIEVYRFFLDRHCHREQAFESARRVFRGGVISGGAPFTKDIVYLDGLIRVHNFLRSAVAEGRADLLELLFVGKLDLADLPLLAEMSVHGLILKPKFKPPWVEDSRFLIAYLAYSSFLNTIDLGAVRGHYRQQLKDAPLVAFEPRG